MEDYEPTDLPTVWGFAKFVAGVMVVAFTGLIVGAGMAKLFNMWLMLLGLEG